MGCEAVQGLQSRFPTMCKHPVILETAWHKRPDAFAEQRVHKKKVMTNTAGPTSHDSAV
jgi:hypothetical protein